MNFNAIYSQPPERGGVIDDINLLGNDTTRERANFSMVLFRL
jgi:hypothetical protein